MKVGEGIGVSVEGAGKTVAVEVCGSRNGIEPDLMRFEQGAEAVVVLVANGIVFMIVAFGAVDC